MAGLGPEVAVSRVVEPDNDASGSALNAEGGIEAEVLGLHGVLISALVGPLLGL